jgi:hypothetical protein
MKTKIRFAVLELLADDHWIVRQEVLARLDMLLISIIK